jgi:ribonuclease HI
VLVRYSLLMHDQEIKSTKPRLWQLYIDGASRNNPGLAGVGIYLVDDGSAAYKQGFFVGIKTNNQAEYIALLFGIIVLKNHIKNDDIVQIYSDSELLVKQMKGEYRVKDCELQKLQRVAKEWLQPISYDIGHVLREKNKVADSLANAGIDQKIRVPETFLAKLNEHAISL